MTNLIVHNCDIHYPGENRLSFLNSACWHYVQHWSADLTEDLFLSCSILKLLYLQHHASVAGCWNLYQLQSRLVCFPSGWCGNLSFHWLPQSLILPIGCLVSRQPETFCLSDLSANGMIEFENRIIDGVFHFHSYTMMILIWNKTRSLKAGLILYYPIQPQLMHSIAKELATCYNKHAHYYTWLDLHQHDEHVCSWWFYDLEIKIGMCGYCLPY